MPTNLWCWPEVLRLIDTWQPPPGVAKAGHRADYLTNELDVYLELPCGCGGCITFQAGRHLSLHDRLDIFAWRVLVWNDRCGYSDRLQLKIEGLHRKFLRFLLVYDNRLTAKRRAQ